MKPIAFGQSGPAVEDVQTRLVKLGFEIDEAELSEARFGTATQQAVRSFRDRQGLVPADVVDDATWIELVDETYAMGDRTLYLRLPFFRGADVRHLQVTLNVLGFSCGVVDGLYGPHTEAAVAEFQANVGLMADGMAFQDTFDAIERLHHVWHGKTASPSFSEAHSGLVRAADVLERTKIVVSATDPIARNVASRLWNVAYATTSDANIVLVDSWERAGSEAAETADVVLEVSTTAIAPEDVPLGTVVVSTSDQSELVQRISAAVVGAAPRGCRLRVEMCELDAYDGSVTNRKVQSAAVKLLDALCSALSACS